MLVMQGFAAAAPRLDGTAALTKGNYLIAAARARPLAERGNAQAQTLLGFMYEYGRGVPQNYAEAAYWYRCAADQGHATAQYLLGLLYEKGRGIGQSDTRAYEWLILAAAHAPASSKDYYSRIRDAVAAKLSTAQIMLAHERASHFGAMADR